MSALSLYTNKIRRALSSFYEALRTSLGLRITALRWLGGRTEGRMLCVTPDHFHDVLRIPAVLIMKTT